MKSSSPIFTSHSCPQNVLLAKRAVHSANLENNTEHLQHLCTISISDQLYLQFLLNCTTKIEYLTEIKCLTNAKYLTKIKQLAKMKYLTKIKLFANVNNLIKINYLTKINNFTFYACRRAHIP